MWSPISIEETNEGVSSAENQRPHLNEFMMRNKTKLDLVRVEVPCQRHLQ